MRNFTLTLSTLVLSTSLIACGDSAGGGGTPCAIDEHCQSGVCQLVQPQRGYCTEPRPAIGDANNPGPGNTYPGGNSGGSSSTGGNPSGGNPSAYPPGQRGAPGTLGASCTDYQQCQTGICVTPPEQQAGYCSNQCSGPQDCAGGYECVQVQQDLAVCVQTTQSPGAGNPGSGTPTTPPAQGQCTAQELNQFFPCADSCNSQQACDQCLQYLGQTCFSCLSTYVTCLEQTGCAEQDPNCCTNERVACLGE